MFGGHIVVSLVVDNRGQIVSGPTLSVEGLPSVEDDDETIETLIKRVITGTLKSIPPKRRSDVELLNNALQRAVRGEVTAYWGKKPNVTIFVHGV
jgi:ribonuclease J